MLDRVLELDPAAEYALGNLFYVSRQLCLWDNLAALTTKFMERIANGEPAATPTVMLAATGPARHQLLCALTYVAREYPSCASWEGGHDPHERIRIAYFSADFGDHPVAALLAGVIERHDRERFETIAISFASGEATGMRRRLENAFEQFIDVGGHDDGQVAALLRRLEVDIAIDLMEITHGCRPGILARRVAPVQISYLGYSGTMGAGFIDYIIADRCVIPPDQQSCYAEAVIYLPGTYMPTDNTRTIGQLPVERIAAALPAEGFVFCAFNQHFKITPAVFDLWMRLLGRIENSVLWLSAGEPQTTVNLCREAERRGIDASRLVFCPARGQCGRSSRAPSPRRPVPGHLAVQRPCDGGRCAVGGRSIRVPASARRLPAECREPSRSPRPAGTGHELLGGL